MLNTRIRGVCVAAIAVAATAALPAAAGAATRYTEPGGDGIPPCLVSDPCEIENAIEGASNGDEVILLGGVAPASPFDPAGVSPITVANNVTVHGAPGARPTIDLGTTTTDGIYVYPGSTLRDLNVEHSGGAHAAILLFGGTLERVVSHTTSPDSFSSCYAFAAATIRDSVCWYDTNSIQGAGIDLIGNAGGGTLTVRNSTAISTGATPGIRARSVGVPAPVIVTNSIARSESGSDVTAQLLGAEAATVTLDHSNYDTESDPAGATAEVTDPGSATNQMAPPVFVNAAGGDFRQAATSAGTLNLGTATGLLPGELDLGGATRLQGSAPDIGAFEATPTAVVVPPPAETTPPAKKKCKKPKKRSAAAAKKSCKKKKRK